MTTGNELATIGLSAQEEALYTALVRRNQATAAELATECGVSRHTADRTLRTLVAMRLAMRAGSRPTVYMAVAPDSAIDAILREQEDAIRAIRARARELMDDYQAGARFADPERSIEVVSGRETVRERWLQLQRQSREQVRAFDRPPYNSTTPYAGPNDTELSLLARGVTYRVLYDHSVMDYPGWFDHIRSSVANGEQARMTSGLPMKLVISDARQAIVPLLRARDPAVDAAYIVYPSPLLDALIALFETAWSRGSPIRSGAPAAAAATDPDLSDDELTLLSTLALGVTDRVAADRLGRSERTVQRQVQRIMARLGVRSRFQLGVEANRRGWT
ncbi:MAG TPA: helix-turn-helix domain-containing protein [Natronosporangium sp.]